MDLDCDTHKYIPLGQCCPVCAGKRRHKRERVKLNNCA